MALIDEFNKELAECGSKARWSSYNPGAITRYKLGTKFVNYRTGETKGNGDYFSCSVILTVLGRSAMEAAHNAFMAGREDHRVVATAAGLIANKT